MTTRFRAITWACLAGFVSCIVAAVLYFGAGHVKHGVAFVALAVVAALGVWFTSGPEKQRAKAPARENATTESLG